MKNYIATGCYMMDCRLYLNKDQQKQMDDLIVAAKGPKKIKLSDFEAKSDNRNVIFMEVPNIGRCKLRGWNQKIRFDEEGKTDFIEFFTGNSDGKVNVIFSKNSKGEYSASIIFDQVYKFRRV